MRNVLRIAVVVFIVILLDSNPPQVTQASINKQEDPKVVVKEDTSTDQPHAEAAQEQPKQVVSAQEESKQTVVKAPTGDKYELMQLAGIPQNEWPAVDYIVSHESSWRHTAWNSSGSGAYGLCQALPASKMQTSGNDYKTNPVTQLKWCSNYASNRYGGWWQAYNFWVANKWW